MLNIQRNIRKLINHRGHKPLIDHLPENNLPSTVSLATSWNMPRNTTQLGSTGWERFVFEGTTPSGEIPGTNPKRYYDATSRIEIAVAGATNCNVARTIFQTNHGDADTIATQHITFDNNKLTKRFILTQFRVCDAANTLENVSTQDTISLTGGMIWQREYDDNSLDMVVFNPSLDEHTIEDITSDAKIWLLHADATGNWSSGRLFGASEPPSFGTTLPGAQAIAIGGSNGMEVQHEISF